RTGDCLHKIPTNLTPDRVYWLPATASPGSAQFTNVVNCLPESRSAGGRSELHAEMDRAHRCRARGPLRGSGDNFVLLRTLVPAAEDGHPPAGWPQRAG